MKVLFNADDFGLTKGVTDGIIQAHTNGVVQSTTLMMNGLATDYAVAKAKMLPSLQVGIHLVLTYGKPLSDDVPTLLNEQGSFKYTNTFKQMEPPNIEEVEKEWRTQLDAFLATGLPLHHIDSHHHVHGWPVLKEVVLALSKDYDVPVRYTDSLKDYPAVLLTENLYLDFYGDGIHKDVFKSLELYKGNSVEVMTHPAIVDDDLRTVSSYLDAREEELSLLCHLEIPDWVDLEIGT
ncbi:chitin disaccharide deacetylase [Sporosarcina gallistercoris]|uniref:Chitin disaccharide deacetylase n=1 Tax=Sporosarcina gallistercoris TaxID=2762245 RepID=A0ABR8PJ87_9BACL|nr:chitin disaccharide deacetylase [Sporosarcina gallistercoris]MBD7908221.1 chitin disaccharide deacetylase [Sporosarcina gallistercoris]